VCALSALCAISLLGRWNLTCESYRSRNNLFAARYSLCAKIAVPWRPWSNPGYALEASGKVCALSALCAISLRGDGFRAFDFGPEGCGPSPADGGFAIDEAEGHQLFQSEVDALFAYMAIEEGPDLHPG
jgi:hypothetical protein